MLICFSRCATWKRYLMASGRSNVFALYSNYRIFYIAKPNQMNFGEVVHHTKFQLQNIFTKNVSKKSEEVLNFQNHLATMRLVNRCPSRAETNNGPKSYGTNGDNEQQFYTECISVSHHSKWNRNVPERFRLLRTLFVMRLEYQIEEP